ncbi:MAG: DUF2760 domain-containing protein [Pirellulales bacterium]
MSRLVLAFRAFFAVLFDRSSAERVAQCLLPAPAAETAPEPAKPAPKAARRSDAVQLLATLQREARLVDFLLEPIAGYADDQIGAAVRNVHRDCQGVLERAFGLKPLFAEAEGSPLEVPAGFDAARIRLTGQIAGDPPYQGTLVHAGWLATRCELPEWTGKAEGALVVAPAEVEVR